MPKISEQEFFTQILDLAHIFHWRVAHFRPAGTIYGWRTAVAGDGAGFPDCVLARPPRLVVAELKSDKGKVTPEQEVWLDLLAGCPGVEVYLWRPDDFEDISDILMCHSVEEVPASKTRWPLGG